MVLKRVLKQNWICLHFLVLTNFHRFWLVIGSWFNRLDWPIQSVFKTMVLGDTFRHIGLHILIIDKGTLENKITSNNIWVSFYYYYKETYMDNSNYRLIFGSSFHILFEEFKNNLLITWIFSKFSSSYIIFKVIILSPIL